MYYCERFVDHPFKRRRRKCFNLSARLVLLLMTAVSSTTAFVPFSLIRGNTLSLLNIHENASGNDAKGGFSRDDDKSYRIPSEQIERLKESTDIVSVIESYGLPGFRRQGNNRAKAICPFHNDHNPSLSIDGQRGLYKCFSCGAGGDVFNFVREYSALKSEPMTFYQAVRYVAQEYGDPNLKLDFVSSSSRMSDEERRALNEKKQRLLLANAAAAAFYAKCLVTVPAAGAARSHIQERGLSPASVKTFAMGYAPDGYFRDDGEWGKGSLVEHLRTLGFLPSEIIAAGLATRTKGAQWKKAGERNVNATSSHELDEGDKDYSTLIDRFRNRLVVPIFDSKGKSVLGFGARILPPEEIDSSGYKAPKYINSPESLVFQKKNVLFGQHYASEAVREKRQAVAAGEPGPERGSVVVVEGYMDAILLWEAGIHEAIASMGTALTLEQLTNAARTAGTHGGRIVLCFDGDEAGLNAIERLCTGSLLSKTAETYVIEIRVATLPEGVKDPGEYIESKSKSQGGERFRKEIIDTAKDWTAWYLDRLLSRYDDAALRGTAGSFADICDRISDFLSVFPNPAERTKRAHDVAGPLADLVAGKSDSGEGSNALLIQLETDLVNMVSRKAGARESIERRIESVEGFSPDTTQKLARMTRGNGITQSDDSANRLSSRALRASNRKDSQGKARNVKKASSRRAISHTDHTSGKNGRRSRARMQRSSSRRIGQPPLTPHFSGFDFENASDADWLKLPREKWKRKKQDLTLGTSMDGERYAEAKAARIGEERVSDLLLDGVVYFNSNAYHGQQFLTQDAIDAGYNNGEVARDASIFEQGVGTLVRQDANILVDAAEEKLLRNVVRYSRARKAMVHSLATRDATGSSDQIEWSRLERAWLFERLVEQSNSIPSEIMVDGKTSDLRFYLANLPDTPAGAFGVDESPEQSTNAAEATPPSPNSPNDPESPRSKSLGTDLETHIDISSSAEEMNTPSDSDDIENWAAAYDPTIFEDADSQEASPSVEVEAVPREIQNSVTNNKMSPGCLDGLFVPDEDHFADTYDDSVSRELRAELEVQEAHSTLLRAAALKKLSAVKSKWLAVGRVLDTRLEEQDAIVGSDKLAEDDSLLASDGVIDLNSMSIEDLKAHQSTIASTLRDISKKVHQLDTSAKRIGSRLMDYSNADGIEGRVSVAQQEELAAMVDEYLNNLPENWKAPDCGHLYRSHNNRDPSLGWSDDSSLERVESLEEDMIQIDKDWGEWADDDFVWSPEDSLDSSKLSHSTLDSSSHNILDNFELEARIDEDDESAEEAIRRLDSEWAGWDDDETQASMTGVDPLSKDEIRLTDHEANDSIFE